MNKSLLIASFAVLTANTFGMGSGYHGESSGRRNSKPKFQEIRPVPIPYSELAHMCDQLFRMNEENKKLIEGQNNKIAVLNQQCLKAESLAQTLQIKNENQESLLRQKNDEISNWKDKLEKQRLSTERNADKVERQEKEIKKVREGKEELESSLQEKNKKIEEIESSLQEKDGKIKELTEWNEELTERIEKLKQKIERDREKRRKLQKEKDADIENLMVQVVELERKLEESLNSKTELTERSREKRQKPQEENADRKRAKVNSVKESISKDKFTYLQPYHGHSDTYGNVALYRQSHYEKSNGSETPTTILVRSNGRPEKLESILERRYANNVSHKKIADPKVILYRSNTNKCYIVLKIDDKNYGIVYGLEECFIGTEKKSFSVYEVSKDMESFTDNVLRLIYVDNSGLYIVPAKENPIEQVKEKYEEKGQFDFKGSILKVSAIDGSITWNGEPVTDENFFDNWELEKYEVVGEHEIENQIPNEQGETVKNKKKNKPRIKTRTRTVLSKKQPNQREILRNFYPPKGKFEEMYQSIRFRNTSNWINSFVNIYLKNKAEGLVNNGKFRANLLTYLNRGCCKSELYSALANLSGISSPRNPGLMVCNNKEQFRNPDFVRNLKPIFEKIKKDCNHGTKFDDWSLFTIVKNL